MKYFRLLAVLGALFAFSSLAACEDEGPLEEAVEEVDEAAEEAAEDIDEAVEDLDD